MSCILHFKGKNFDTEQVIAALQVVPYVQWKQDEPQRFGRHKFFPTSGFSFVASGADFDAFKQQVVDVIDFIIAHKPDLSMLGDLAKTLDAGEFYFDFGLYTRVFTIAVQVDFLPAELIKLCGDIGTGIMLSQYPPSEEEEDGDEID